MSSFTGKAIKDVYKDLLHTNNSNTGISTTIKQIACGDGDTTSLYLSSRNTKVQPASDTTTNTVIYDADGNALFTVDSTNDLIKLGIGQHTANTQFKEFGIWDFSPTAGTHYALTTYPTITTTSDADFSGAVNGSAWGGTGTNPATSLTVASAAIELIPSLWILQQNITLDQINYAISADGSSTANIHLMSYDVVSGSGTTAGDLTSGAVLAQTGSSAGSLSPVTIGSDRVSNGTLTKNNSEVNSGKAIIAFVENVGGTDDVSVQLNIKYHLR